MVSDMLRGLVLIPSIVRDDKVQSSFYFTPAKPLPSLCVTPAECGNVTISTGTDGNAQQRLQVPA